MVSFVSVVIRRLFHSGRFAKQIGCEMIIKLKPPLGCPYCFSLLCVVRDAERRQVVVATRWLLSALIQVVLPPHSGAVAPSLEFVKARYFVMRFHSSRTFRSRCRLLAGLRKRVKAEMYRPYNGRIRNGIFQCCAVSPKTWRFVPTWLLSSCMSLSKGQRWRGRERSRSHPK